MAIPLLTRVDGCTRTPESHMDVARWLQAASPEAIDRHLQRLLTADSLAAVFAD